MDEEWFIQNGILNIRDQQTRADENPHSFQEIWLLQQFAIHAWAGIIGDLLLGPYDLPPRLSEAPYLTITAATGRRTTGNAARNEGTAWCGSVFSSRNVMRYLDTHYPDRLIGRNGRVVWPPRSPELTPAYFYLWGHLKTILFSQRCNTREELWNAIEAAGTIIRSMPDVFQRTRNSWRNCSHLCID
jgi:hypothetical protein